MPLVNKEGTAARNLNIGAHGDLANTFISAKGQHHRTQSEHLEEAHSLILREALQVVHEFHATARNLSIWTDGNLANTVTGEERQRHRTQTEHTDADESLSLREAAPCLGKRTLPHAIWTFRKTT